MPDGLSERAARRMLEAMAGLGEEDRVIALISGGGSALMSLPAPGITLAEKQAINRALLRCGAPIREINTVRRHLSAIKGGRNVEYLLGLFEALKGAPGIHALAIDTDGIDGSEDNAGALFGPDDWARAEAMKLDPIDHLSRNDAYTFFEALDRLIVTGPTRTNVNDFRAILVLPRTP